jgi:hypothetical protein
VLHRVERMHTNAIESWLARMPIFCDSSKTIIIRNSQLTLAAARINIFLFQRLRSMLKGQIADVSGRAAASVRSMARSLGVGSALLRLNRIRQFGIRLEVGGFLARRHYLRVAKTLQPMESSSGPLDCFMLLNERRFCEGVWSLYSFRLHFGPSRLIVLNDGTLKNASIGFLHDLFPGIRIPEFHRNNEDAAAFLSKRGLIRLRHCREHIIWFRKLVDPLMLASSDKIFLLDSDCSHFSQPQEIHQWIRQPKIIRYIGDPVRYPLCAPADELRRICGRALPEHFCAGYFAVLRSGIDLNRIEEYLHDQCFDQRISQGRLIDDQTLYAMEAAVVGAEMLPPQYATCPSLDTESAVMGHFCGGSYKRMWFYTVGLPLVRSQIDGAILRSAST